MRTVFDPKYYLLPSKKEARKYNIRIYRKLTGLNSIPVGRQYWTLCNLQPLDELGSEINQLLKLGFLKKSQFYGVDWDEEIITKNKEWHPEAHWFCGEWTEVIKEEEFNPAFVYLDTTSFASFQNAVDMVSSTMYLCKKNCVIAVNLMLSDPRSKRIFDDAEFVKNIQKNVGPKELKKWDSTVRIYDYNATGKTLMITYILHKEAK